MNVSKGLILYGKKYFMLHRNNGLDMLQKSAMHFCCWTRVEYQFQGVKLSFFMATCLDAGQFLED